MVSCNRDRFLLLATTVFKEIVKKSVLDSGKPSLKATDRWRSAQTMLWSQDLSDFSDSFIKNWLQNKQSLLIYKVLLWKNRTCGSCYYSLTINRISEPRDISYPVLTNQQNHDSAVSLSYLFLKMMNDISDMTLYNKDKFILSVTFASKEMEKISFWQRKPFSESYWQMMKCLC